MSRKLLLFTLLFAFTCVAAIAAGIDGKWTAKFDTPIGEQNYTYNFHVEGATVTGTASNGQGSSKIQEGKIDGDTITFVESLNFDGNVIKILYTGKIHGDEIKFTRAVGEFGTEELTAVRAK